MDKITHVMRREKWRAIIQECNESGIPKRDWLRAHNINQKTYYNWQRKLRMEIGTELVLAQNNALAAVQKQTTEFCQIIPPVSEEQRSYAVIRTDHLSIEVNDNISNEFLLRLLKAASNV